MAGYWKESESRLGKMDLNGEYTQEDIKGLKYGATTTFSLAPRETFLVCPFNPVHVVRSSSFFKHKLKCERKFKEEQGIPDTFNAKMYQNRFRSSLVNSKPFPKPPPNVRDLSEILGPLRLGTSSGPGDPGNGATKATGKPPIPELTMADMCLPYFEPSGLSPAARREFRNRRHVAAGYKDKVNVQGHEVPPSDKGATGAATCDDEFQLIEDIEEYETIEDSADDGKAGKGKKLSASGRDDDEETEECEEEDEFEDASDQETESEADYDGDTDEFVYLSSEDGNGN